MNKFLIMGCSIGLIIIGMGGLLLSLATAIKANNYQELNGFTITAYCPNSCCNKHWAGLLSNGKTMKEYIDSGVNIVAVDPKVIPLGSKIFYNGREYTALDVGSAIKNKKIDILVSKHRDTFDVGLKTNQTIYIGK